jgi:hypothetical protein
MKIGSDFSPQFGQDGFVATYAFQIVKMGIHVYITKKTLMYGRHGSCLSRSRKYSPSYSAKPLHQSGEFQGSRNPYTYIANMPEAEHMAYLQNIQNFLSTSSSSEFSNTTFVQTQISVFQRTWKD